MQGGVFGFECSRGLDLEARMVFADQHKCVFSFVSPIVAILGLKR